MHHQGGRREGVLCPLQCRIELFHEIKFQAAPGTMERKVKARTADQVQIGKVMLGAKHSTDAETRRVEFFQAAKMRFGRTRLTRQIGKANR